MRKPFTSEQIKNSPMGGVFDDTSISENVIQDIEHRLFILFANEEKITEKQYNSALDASDAFVNDYVKYLMQNDPQTPKPTQGTFEDAVRAAESKLKEALGEHLGGELIREIQQSLDKQYEEALGIQSLKRA
jgi:hypothetical protein